jgi:deoxyribonuclease V
MSASSPGDIACVDVDYREPGAVAACVVLPAWDAQAPSHEVSVAIDAVAPYEPGRFYLRELPCLIAVLRVLPSLPRVVVVDGHVWLGERTAPGLGVHLHAALAEKAIVVGVAKTAFKESALVAPVLRGTSARPLFVSVAGAELAQAVAWVRGMHGAHRIPTALQRVDRLCRTAQP